MTSKLITEAAAMAVTLADAREAARADGTALDNLIELQVRAITAGLEHTTRRAIITQTWRVTLDAFPSAIKLPRSPAQSVTSLQFIDADGVLQTLDPADYMVDDESEPGYIVPAPGLAWPATAAQVNAVKVEVVLGYGPDSTTTPDGIKGYILAKVQETFAAPGTPPQPNLERLLDRYMVY